MTAAKQHRWTFSRAGGVDQVRLDSGQDLVNLDHLDQKLWAALACPTQGLELDARTLELIDTDHDGRVRAPELLAAIRFAVTYLKDPNDLLKGKGELALGAIQQGSAEGKTLHAAASRVLSNLGKPEAQALTVEDVADPSRIFAETAFNGDGIITELSTADEAVATLIKEIAECVGSELDRSGKPGVSTTQVDRFFEEVAAYGDWYIEGEIHAESVFPFGIEETAAAYAAVSAIRPKVDDYFARCRLAAFDPRIAQLLNRKEEEYLEVVAQDLSITADEVAGFPLAQVGPQRALPLDGPLNPAHLSKIRTLQAQTLEPLLGPRRELSEADWQIVCQTLTPYQTWLATKPSLSVDKLGEPRLRQLRTSTLKETLYALIAQDKALEPEALHMENVERLVRYHRDLYLLCTNFVNFKDFYDGDEAAVFQRGVLYLDQRACSLCLQVTDPAKHAALAGLAGACLAYLECSRAASGEKMTIVAVFTNGDSDNLLVGRNGLFYDRKGNDWDATLVKLIDNPISVRQAFWSPYKKLVRFVEEQVSKRAAAADAASTQQLQGAATEVTQLDASKPPPAPKKVDVGTVAALGVAAGALGAFLTAFVGYATGILKLGILASLGAFVGLLLLISLPSVVMAYLKLRRRNLGPLLDASGWAVNTRALINVPFGTTLTKTAKLPKGSRRVGGDPYAQKGFPWKRLLLLAFVLYGAYRWYVGGFDRYLPAPARATSVLGAWAPTAAPSPVPDMQPHVHGAVVL